MGRLICRRLISTIPLLIIISIISFIIIQLPPGDFVTEYIGELKQAGLEFDMVQEEALRRRYGLDRPLYMQYLYWIREILLLMVETVIFRTPFAEQRMSRKRDYYILEQVYPVVKRGH